MAWRSAASRHAGGARRRTVTHARRRHPAQRGNRCSDAVRDTRRTTDHADRRTRRAMARRARL